MFASLFKKPALDKETQYARCYSYTVQTWAILLMREKMMSIKQCQFVIDFILEKAQPETAKGAAYFFTENMMLVQNNTGYMGYQRYSNFINDLSKKLKNTVFLNLILLLLLEEKEVDLRHNYIHQILRDVGLGEFAYMRICAKAQKAKKSYIPKRSEAFYKDAFSIIHDALARSDLDPIGY